MQPLHSFGAGKARKRSRPKSQSEPADGPVFLTRGRGGRWRVPEQYNCTWCTDGCAISGEEDLKRHVENKHPDQRSMEKLDPRAWYEFVVSAKVPRKGRKSLNPNTAKDRRQKARSGGHLPNGQSPPRDAMLPTASPGSPQKERKTGMDDDDEAPELLLQPETRIVSQQQLVIEVRGIFAGLVMVEAKCIGVDKRQDVAEKKLTPEQWRALIALHETLLHQHHDFFLASKHPSASSMLSQLADKYNMPSRMWSCAIQGFLEVLRHRLPYSLEFMLAFIYITYNMLALLYETVPSFEDTWMECLGDLSRYRLSIEDDEEARQIWFEISRSWYLKAIDKNPKIGRLYHHLGILSRPVSQLSLFVRSLTCDIPFPMGRESILHLFDRVLDRALDRDTTELLIVRAHAIIFTGRYGRDFLPTTTSLTEGLFDKLIRHTRDKFKKVGVAIAQANIGALLGYGLTTPEGVPLGQLYLTLESERQSSKSPSLSTGNDAGSETEQRLYTTESLTDKQRFLVENLLTHASILTFGLFEVILSRPGDKNMLPAVHIHLLFISFLLDCGSAFELLSRDIPWEKMVSFLNALLRTSGINQQMMFETEFPMPPVGSQWPLFEDFLLRGQRYAQNYFPEYWFEQSLVDEEERYLEQESMSILRAERILWIGQRIAGLSGLMSFDRTLNKFAVSNAVKALEPRKITETLVPHSLPPEESTEVEHQIKHERSPSPSGSFSQILEMVGSLPARIIKEGQSSSPFQYPKHEDTEMTDAPVHQMEPLQGKRETGLDMRMAETSPEPAGGDK